MKILFLLGRRVDQAWVRGRIARLELLDALEIARIGHDDREFLELVQLGSGLVLFDRGGCHIFSSSIRRADMAPAQSEKQDAAVITSSRCDTVFSWLRRAQI